MVVNLNLTVASLESPVFNSNSSTEDLKGSQVKSGDEGMVSMRSGEERLRFEDFVAWRNDPTLPAMDPQSLLMISRYYVTARETKITPSATPDLQVTNVVLLARLGSPHERRVDSNVTSVSRVRDQLERDCVDQGCCCISPEEVIKLQ